VGEAELRVPIPEPQAGSALDMGLPGFEPGSIEPKSTSQDPGLCCLEEDKNFLRGKPHKLI